MHTAIEARMSAALAAPMTHAVVTTYADGTEKRHKMRCAKSAANYATGERRKVGRDLINRASGAAVRVVSVSIVPIV